MTELYDALAEFWAGFGLNAFRGEAYVYDELGRRTRPELPYITYEVKRPAFGTTTIVRGELWDRGKSSDRLNKVLGKIERKVPESGLLLTFSEGSIWLRRATNFIEHMNHADPDDVNIKRVLISLELQGFLY
jgi:hypothetical protein